MRRSSARSSVGSRFSRSISSCWSWKSRAKIKKPIGALAQRWRESGRSGPTARATGKRKQRAFADGLANGSYPTLSCPCRSVPDLKRPPLALFQPPVGDGRDAQIATIPPTSGVPYSAPLARADVEIRIALKPFPLFSGLHQVHCWAPIPFESRKKSSKLAPVQQGLFGRTVR
jgi:hypothetical protein